MWQATFQAAMKEQYEKEWGDSGKKREGMLAGVLVWRRTAGLALPSAIYYRDVLHAAFSSLQNGAEWGGGGAKPGMVISSLCCGFRACGVAWARGPCDWAAVASKRRRKEAASSLNEERRNGKWKFHFNSWESWRTGEPQRKMGNWEEDFACWWHGPPVRHPRLLDHYIMGHFIILCTGL